MDKETFNKFINSYERRMMNYTKINEHKPITIIDNGRSYIMYTYESEQERKAKDKIEKIELYNNIKDYIRYIFIDFIKFDVSDEAICSVLLHKYYDFFPYNINLLLQRQLYNKYANLNGIRYEDSVEILTDFINKIFITNKCNYCNNEYKITNNYDDYYNHVRYCKYKN